MKTNAKRHLPPPYFAKSSLQNEVLNYQKGGYCARGDFSS